MPSKVSSRSNAARRKSQGPLVAEFIESCCRIVKGDDAGQLVQLRKWQRDLLRDLFVLRPDGKRQYRRALIGLPRKNGKSMLGSAIALFGLVLDDEPGAEVYSAAGTRDQARIVFGVAKRMVELDPELSAKLKLYRDAIEFPQYGSVYRVLSSDAPAQEGLNPSLVVFDELHVQPDDRLWNTLTLGSGARSQPLIMAITTAGVKSDSSGGDSICYRLYQYGKRLRAGEETDPSFFFWWKEPADPEAPHDSPKVWKEANPALGDFLAREDFEVSIRTTPEPEFRTKRLNQFVSSVEAWLPHGAFEQRQADRAVGDGESIVLGFDGSYNGDSTALVGCTDDGHLFVIDAWEKRDTDDIHWRVDILDVERAILDACKRWKVREVACDPFRWQRSMQVLEEAGVPIVEWPTSSPMRMVPACAKFYDAVMDAKLTHDGDARLMRHVRNCVLKIDAKGPRVVKDHRGSPRKIDLAVAAIVAYDRAVQPQEAELVPFGVWA